MTTLPWADTQDRAVYTERPRSRNHDRAQAIRALTHGRPVIYACRLADGTIKIGCSEHLDERRKKFGPGAEIIAFVFGTRDEELAIHATLVPHRARGREYYHPTAEVLAVVNTMRETFNLEPIAS